MHEFQSYDPNLSIRGLLAILGVDLGQEAYIWVESNANSVDEQDWEPFLGGVWAVPVSGVFCRGPKGGK